MTYPFVFIFVNRVEVLGQQVLPELQFGARQEVHLAAFQVTIFNPVRIHKVISFMFSLCKAQYIYKIFWQGGLVHSLANSNDETIPFRKSTFRSFVRDLWNTKENL